jgi:hypothetical protein
MTAVFRAVTQAEFARIIGVARSYVTALKKAGRLVQDSHGQVLVEASIKRIAETADPNRDDVRERHAEERGQPVTVDMPETEETAEQPISHDYQRARAKKEYFLAEQARIAFERDIGKLIPKSEVDAAIEDVISALRQAIENMPHRTAPELVGKDLDAIRATLKQEIHNALADMEREFGKRLNQMGSEE